MKLLKSLFRGLMFLITGGQYGKFVEGKMCPKCNVRRININKYCCKQCYEKYYKK